MYCRAICVIAMALGGASCADRRVQPPEQTHPDLLAGEFSDEFWIGDVEVDRQFVDISSMAFTPDGHLVVLDSDAYAVTVFDVGGREVATWGSRGRGPGEFLHPPGRMAVSDDAAVAIDTNSGRVDLFSVGGELIDSHPLEGLSVTALAFDGEGNVLAKARSLAITSTMPSVASYEVVRIGDGRVMWSSRPLPTIRSLMLYSPHGILADIGRGQIAVGISDTYDISVLDAATGRMRGRIARDVPIRGPTEDFVNRFKDMARDRGRIPAATVEQVTFASTFPVTDRVFVGPPGRTVWVFRNWGIDDDLSPAVRELEDGTVRLYDLFSSDTYQYVGTVRVPDHLELMAGDATRVAGVYTNELDVQSVRVMRFGLPSGQPSGNMPRR